jgi:hypothetical protein
VKGENRQLESQRISPETERASLRCWNVANTDRS